MKSPRSIYSKKFMNLWFYFPDKNAVYKVCDRNFEWKGKNGWVAIAEKEEGNDSGDEPITLALVCELVAENAEKNEDIEIMKDQES